MRARYTYRHVAGHSAYDFLAPEILERAARHHGGSVVGAESDLRAALEMAREEVSDVVGRSIGPCIMVVAYSPPASAPPAGRRAWRVTADRPWPASARTLVVWASSEQEAVEKAALPLRLTDDDWGTAVPWNC